jgi:hypothetical protein
MADQAETRSIVVTWDELSQAVIFRIAGHVEGEPLRQACDKTLELLESRQSSRLITDSREMKALTQKDQRWIDDDWGPRARAAGLRWNAILVPKSAVAQLTVTSLVNHFGDLQFGYFFEEDEARRWLDQPEPLPPSNGGLGR